MSNPAFPGNLTVRSGIFFPHLICVSKNKTRDGQVEVSWVRGLETHSRYCSIDEAGRLVVDILNNGIGVDDPLRGGQDYTSPT